MLTIYCSVCSTPFLVKPYRKDKALYCSSKCYGIAERGIIPKSAFKKGCNISPATQFKSGKLHPYFGKSSPALGKRWKCRPSLIPRGGRGIPRLSMQAAHHPNWQGGVTPINKKERNKLEYKLWREAIFKRDNYTCVLCGAKDKYFNADHIKPFSLYPELRLSLDNGRTLCIECHEKTDTYKGRARQKKLVN